MEHSKQEPGFVLPPDTRELIARIHANRLTYLRDNRLAFLARSCIETARAGVVGRYIETGCALGGSTVLIAALKPAGRPFDAYEVFGMIPAPTADDPPEVHARYQVIREGKATGIGGDTYYGYRDDLRDFVAAQLSAFGTPCDTHAIRLVPGLLQETLHVDAPVAFAHIDVDWYDPVRTALARILPWLSPGGSVVLDDYHDWGGCRRAVDEFLASAGDAFEASSECGPLRLQRRTGLTPAVP